MEEEVDPSIKREKHKENRVMNVGCEDDFFDNPITNLIKKEVKAGDVGKVVGNQVTDRDGTWQR